VNSAAAASYNVFWEGSQFVHHSLALANREYCVQLLDAGLVHLTIVPYEPDQFTVQDDPKWQRLVAHDLRNKKYAVLEMKKRPTIWVRHQWPPRGQKPPRGAKWVIMQPWEYSILPTVYADILQQADEIWTASSYARAALLASGLAADRTFVIPYGVDSDLYSPTGERCVLPAARSFTFLFVGAPIYRKGLDILLRAFSQAFTAHDDVCLIVKTAATPVYNNQLAHPLIVDYAARPHAPKIISLTNFLDARQLAQLYRAADVFVLPYRGEGFSLPTLEAMACGLPVIVTAGGATDDFVDGSVGWQIHADRLPVGHTIYGLPLPSAGFLLRPDLDHLVTLLRTAYGARDEVIRKGQHARSTAQRWTWGQATRGILERMRALSTAA
jgi:glycosyltransferase involved in cell wall biosynthesis